MNADHQQDAIEDVLGYTRFIHEGRPTPATFFVLGNMVEERPDLVAQELHQGHAVGGHTFDHPHMGLLALGDQIGEFNDLDQAFENNHLPRPQLFRPPYASFNADTIELLDHRRLLMVLWSIDTGDYLDPGSEVVAERRSTASGLAR